MKGSIIQKAKKGLAVLLCAALVVSVAPFAASASASATVFYNTGDKMNFEKTGTPKLFERIREGDGVNTNTYVIKGGPGAGMNGICLEHSLMYPGSWVNYTVKSLVKHGGSVKGRQDIIYKDAKHTKPEIDHRPRLNNGHTLTDGEVYGIITIVKYGKEGEAHVTSPAEKNYAIQNAMRAYIDKSMSYPGSIEFGGAPQKDSRGRYWSGNLRAASTQHNDVFLFAYQLYSLALKAEKEGRIPSDERLRIADGEKELKIKVNGGTAFPTPEDMQAFIKNSLKKYSFSVPVDSTIRWALTQESVSNLKEHGMQPDKEDGTKRQYSPNYVDEDGAAASTKALAFRNVDVTKWDTSKVSKNKEGKVVGITYSLDVGVLSFQKRSTANVYWADPPAATQTQTYAFMNLAANTELTAYTKVSITLAADTPIKPQSNTPDPPTPRIPHFTVWAHKLDAEGGQDGNPHTPQGNLRLNAKFSFDTSKDDFVLEADNFGHVDGTEDGAYGFDVFENYESDYGYEPPTEPVEAVPMKGWAKNAWLAPSPPSDAPFNTTRHLSYGFSGSIVVTETPPTGYSPLPARSYPATLTARTSQAVTVSSGSITKQGNWAALSYTLSIPGYGIALTNVPEDRIADAVFDLYSAAGGNDSTYAKAENTTFVNRLIRRGNLRVVKQEEKGFDPWGNQDGTKANMKGAEFALFLGDHIDGIYPPNAEPVKARFMSFDGFDNIYQVEVDEVAESGSSMTPALDKDGQAGYWRRDGSATQAGIADPATANRTFVTSNNGSFRVNGLAPGTYSLVEVKSNSPVGKDTGYVLETRVVEVLPDGEVVVWQRDGTEIRNGTHNETCAIVNYVVRQSLRIIKVDSETGKRIPQPKTVVRIRYLGNPQTPEADRSKDPNYGKYIGMSAPASSNLLAAPGYFHTDANGIIDLPYTLPFGIYQLEETVPPDGYYIGKYDGLNDPLRAEHTEQYKDTVTLFDSNGAPVQYGLDPSDTERIAQLGMVYVYQTFTVAEAGLNPDDVTEIEIVHKNNPVKGKIEVNKLAERITGWNVSGSSFGFAINRGYTQQLPKDGVAFDIYAKSDIVAADGLDSPLFVGRDGAALSLDKVFESHNMGQGQQMRFDGTYMQYLLSNGAIRYEYRKMPGGTQLGVLTERKPTSTHSTQEAFSAQQYATLVTPDDTKANEYGYSYTTLGSLGTALSYDYRVSSEYTKDGFVSAAVHSTKKSVQATASSIADFTAGTEAVIRAGGESMTGYASTSALGLPGYNSPLFAGGFAGGNLAVITKATGFVPVTTAEALAAGLTTPSATNVSMTAVLRDDFLPAPPKRHYEFETSGNNLDDGIYVYRSENGSMLATLVWKDPAKSSMLWVHERNMRDEDSLWHYDDGVRAMVHSGQEGQSYLLPADARLLLAAGVPYLTTSSAFAPDAQTSQRIVDAVSASPDYAFDTDGTSIIYRAGGAYDVSAGAIAVFATTAPGLRVPSGFDIDETLTQNAGRFVAVSGVGSAAQYVVAVSHGAFGEGIQSHYFVASSDVGVASSGVPDKTAFAELADYEYDVQSSADLGIHLFAKKLSYDPSDTSVPSQADFDALPSHMTVVRFDGGTVDSLVSCTEDGLVFNTRTTGLITELYKVPKSATPIEYMHDGLRVALDRDSAANKGHVLIEPPYPAKPPGITATKSYDARASVKEDALTGAQDLTLSVSEAEAYIKLNDGSTVSAVYGGTHLYMTVDIPLSTTKKNMPKVFYDGGPLDLLESETGERLTIEHPKLDLLPPSASDDRLTGMIVPPTQGKAGYFRFEFVTRSVSAGQAIELEFGDGRTVTLDCIRNADGTVRGIVRASCLTPTYRYLLGERVQTLVTGEDNDGTDYAEGKADASCVGKDGEGRAFSKLLPLGTYIVREQGASDSIFAEDGDHEVTLSYDNLYVPLVWGGASLENRMAEMRLNLKKVFQEGAGSDLYRPKAGAIFGVFAAETIRGAAIPPRHDIVPTPFTKDRLSEGDMIGTLTSDKNGVAAGDFKAPWGRYYIKEISTLSGYSLYDHEVPFEFGEPQIGRPLSIDLPEKGIKAEFRYLEKGSMDVLVRVQQQEPMPTYSIGGVRIDTKAEGLLPLGDGCAATLTRTAIEHTAKIGMRTEKAVVLDFGDGDSLTVTPGDRTYTVTSRQKDATLSSTTARFVPYLTASVTETDRSSAGEAVKEYVYRMPLQAIAYKAELDSDPDTGFVPALKIGEDSGRPVRLYRMQDTAAGTSRLYVQGTNIWNVDTAGTTFHAVGASPTTKPPMATGAGASSGADTASLLAYADIGELADGQRLSYKGTEITVDLSRGYLMLSAPADKSAAMASQQTLPKSLYGMQPDGSHIEEKGGQLALSCLTREIGIDDSGGSGEGVLSAADAQFVGNTLTFARPAALAWRHGSPLPKDSSYALDQNVPYAFLLADGSTVVKAEWNGTRLKMGLEGTRRSGFASFDAPYVTEHGQKALVQDDQRKQIVQETGQPHKTVDGIDFLVSQSRTYARDSSFAPVIEIDISTARSAALAPIRNDGDPPPGGTTTTTPGITTTTPGITTDPGVRIAKLDAASGEMLPGATLAVVEKSTGALMGTWTSTTAPKTLDLPPGEYVLKEAEAPDGFGTAKDITFKVAPGSTGTKVVAMEDERIVWDKGDPGTKTRLKKGRLEVSRSGYFDDLGTGNGRTGTGVATGDPANLALYFTLAGGSLLMLVLSVLYLARKRRQQRM